jgi:hypothetical protein
LSFARRVSSRLLKTADFSERIADDLMKVFDLGESFFSRLYDFTERRAQGRFPKRDRGGLSTKSSLT